MTRTISPQKKLPKRHNYYNQPFDLIQYTFLTNRAYMHGLHWASFKDFLLKPELCRSISDHGFECPSEVQQECIPQALIGQDMLCQAKSGLGKTAVFVLSILNQLPSISPQPFACLILCHTHELATQINDEFIRLGKYLKEIKSCAVYGGENIEKQIKRIKEQEPQIVVGTPGRTLDLVLKKILRLENLKFFILDECDQILQSLDMRSDIQQIFKKTPHDKQVMMFSATMSQEIRSVCRKFMHNVQLHSLTYYQQAEIFINDDSKLTLHGLLQYYLEIPEKDKNRTLSNLLDALLFNQAIIFVKTIQRALHLNQLLIDCGFPSIAIHSQLTQEERLKKYRSFKKFQSRIMVATDIFARGIDIERVNIVINYDIPDNSDSYLHRVGRAGRFGTKGLAITFIASENEKKVLQEIQSRFMLKIQNLPESIDASSYMN